MKKYIPVSSAVSSHFMTLNPNGVGFEVVQGCVSNTVFFFNSHVISPLSAVLNDVFQSGFNCSAAKGLQEDRIMPWGDLISPTKRM